MNIEYRLYYDSETGDILKQTVFEECDGNYLVVDKDTWYTIRQGVDKIIDGKIVKPSSKAFRLVKTTSSTNSYGTIENNIYMVGSNDFYKYSRY